MNSDSDSDANPPATQHLGNPVTDSRIAARSPLSSTAGRGETGIAFCLSHCHLGISTISSAKQMRVGESWKSGCTIGRDRYQLSGIHSRATIYTALHESRTDLRVLVPPANEVHPRRRYLMHPERGASERPGAIIGCERQSWRGRVRAYRFLLEDSPVKAYKRLSTRRVDF